MLPCRKALNATATGENVEHFVNKFAGTINSSGAYVMFDEMLRQTQGRILAEEEEADVADYCSDVCNL